MSLGVAHLLAMTKHLNGVHLIIIGRHCIDSQATFYAFIFSMPLQHINPLDQFKVPTKGGCEAIIHGIKCTLDPHLDYVDWVVL